MKYICKIFLLIFFLTVFPSFLLASAAPAAKLDLTSTELYYLKQHPTLTVANLDSFPPFNFIDKGKPAGYTVEYMQLMGNVLGVKIEFISGKPWPHYLELLKNGKLDIFPHIAVTNERESYVDYTNFNHITYLTGFAVRQTSSITSMKELKGKTIAVTQKSFLHNYLKNNFPEIDLFLTQSTRQAIDAISQEKAFAVIDSLPTLNYHIRKDWRSNLKIVDINDLGIPAKTELPMGVAKGNFVLKTILEKANMAIPFEEASRLKQKWMFDINAQPYQLSIDLTPQETAYLKNKGVIKMCIDPIWMPFEKNDNGKHIGMTADYFNLFEAAIGIPIQMVPTNTWTESLELGKQRKCDIFSLVMPTPERYAYLDFTTPYFKTPLVIATAIHQEWIPNISAVTQKHIGIVKNYSYGYILRNRYPDMKLIDVDNINEGLNQVWKGKLYGFIGTLATVGYHIQQEYIGQLKISGKFTESWDLGIGTRNDEPLLKSIFEKVIQNISPEEHQQILNKWISVSINHDDPNTLSLEEKSFLETHQTIRFQVRPDRPPFEFFKNNTPDGLAVQYIQAIAYKIGFTAEFVRYDCTLPEALNLIEDESASPPFDTLLYSVQSPEREQNFTFGSTYLSYPLMIITNKSTIYIGNLGDLSGKKVALEKGFLTNKWLKRDYPGIEIVNAANTKAALTLVNEEKADAYVGNLAIANYLMEFGFLDNLKVSAPTEYGNIDYRFISPKRLAPLASILSKGYRMISPNEHAEIQQKWFSVQTIEKTDYGPIWKTVIAAAFIICWILWWNRKLQRTKKKTEVALHQLEEAQQSLEEKNRELKRLSITDRLTGLYNRVKLESVMKNELDRAERYKSSFGVIMIDIDHFKRVNDTYGHPVGDKLLIELSKILRDYTRKVDTAGRWGGEEFLVICPHTNEVGIVDAAEHLRATIEHFNFTDAGYQTASFGAAAYSKNDSIESIVSRADEALYRSKKTGRNKVTLFIPSFSKS